MIDAHHHIWMQKDLPWLLGPEQSRIFGPYGAIKRDYLIEEFVDDLKGTGVEKSVYIQANWAPNWFEDEVAWVQSVSDQSGWPHGIVGYADFTVDTARPQLEKLKKYPLMRGIRQQFHWHVNPQYRFAATPDVCSSKTVQSNIALLANYGWTFDLQVFAGQMDSAIELVKSCPDVTFILQHAGMPEDTSPAGTSAWQEAMKRLADCRNATTKLSAFGTFVHRNDPDVIAEVLHATVGIFGAERCMFGSNFPIEKIWTSYGELFRAFKRAAANLPDTQQAAIFHDTAAQIYRL
jgi:predicted TIM-barrel fold metal-dependent hydrolase